MGKIERFRIILEKNFYFPGEVIKGLVNLKVFERFKINFLKLELNASAEVNK